MHSKRFGVGRCGHLPRYFFRVVSARRVVTCGSCLKDSPSFRPEVNRGTLADLATDCIGYVMASAAGLVTFVCLKQEGPADHAALREAAGDAHIVEASDGDVVDTIVAARDRGAVITVGGDGARWALEHGADEAVRVGATPLELRDAIERARARARWRTAYRDLLTPELGGLALFGAATAHSMRDSLMSAMVNCKTLASIAQPVVPPDSKFHETLADVDEALRELAHVVDELHTLACWDETGEASDLTDALIELVAYLKESIIAAADFEATLPEEPCVVRLPKARALEVVAAVLNNAVVAVDGLTARRPRIELRLTREGNAIALEISDNGVGMSPEVCKQALSPFFTAHRPGSLGMGLAFAAATVRRIGGDVLIESQVDSGTRVRLVLPQLPVLEETEQRVIN